MSSIYLINKLVNHNFYQLIKEKVEEVKEFPSFIYPWEGLEEALESGIITHFSLVGYGSLLNSNSARRTLSFEVKNLLPVITFGTRRLYNYKAPLEVIQRYQAFEDPMAIGCLNTMVTYNIEDMLNGLIFELKPEEVEMLRQREKGYDLIPVVSINWHQPDDTIFIHYILSAPKEKRLGQTWVAPNFTPIVNYEKVCQEGAFSVSNDFLEFFLKTTYLADEITLVNSHPMDVASKIPAKGN